MTYLMRVDSQHEMITAEVIIRSYCWSELYCCRQISCMYHEV